MFPSTLVSSALPLLLLSLFELLFLYTFPPPGEDFCCCVTFAYLFKCLRDKFIESFAVRTPSIFSSVKYRTHFQHASMSAWGKRKPPKKRSSSATLNTKHRHTFNEFILRILIPLIHMGTTARNLCWAETAGITTLERFINYLIKLSPKVRICSLSCAERLELLSCTTNSRR